MKLPDPFVTHSPYEEIELTRRGNFVIIVCNAAILFSIPLIVLVGSLLLVYSSALMGLAFLLCLGLPVVSIVAKIVAERGNTNEGGYILISYILILLTVNTTILEGIQVVLIPTFILLILIAGMMFGSLHSFVIVLLASGMYIAARAVESLGIPQVPLPEMVSEITITILVLMSFVFVAYLNRMSTSELRKALSSATYELARTNMELERASEMKTQFTARTSHELRTPLSAIIVFTDLALREAYGPLSEKLENALEHVLTSARHLKGVISDILDISKIEAGELEIVEEPFKGMAIIESLQSSCEIMLDDNYRITCVNQTLQHP